MYERPPPWCSHTYSMVFTAEECWCEACPARWVLVWAPPGRDGRRVPKGWHYAEAARAATR